MRQKLRERFCPHTGDLSAGPENSYGAIKAAVEQDVFYVEFDVRYLKDSLWTGHPPRGPVDELERILPLFEDNETFPKIDLKFGSSEELQEPIDALLSLLGKYNLNFVLINLGGELKGERRNEAQLYFAEQVGNRDNLKLNIAPQCYRPYGEPIDEDFYQEVSSLGDVVFAMSPDIHKEDPDAMGRFAQQHNIPYVCFWLLGHHVKEETLLQALEVEEKYGVKVLFDMNEGYVSE